MILCCIALNGEGNEREEEEEEKEEEVYCSDF